MLTCLPPQDLPLALNVTQLITREKLSSGVEELNGLVDFPRPRAARPSESTQLTSVSTERENEEGENS